MSRIDYAWPLFFLVLLLLAGCDLVQVRGPGKSQLFEEFTLNTTDGVLIAVSYYPSSSSKGLIMLPMLSKTRATYDDVAQELMAHYKVLAVDFRGHGDSEGDYLDLAEEDFRDMVLDVEAAAAYLQQQYGVAEGDISVVGASIGANIALLYASEHPVDKLVLLSPSTRIRGVDISRVVYGGPLLVQVGHYDGYSSISVDSLVLNWQRGRVMEYDTSAHGTDLLVYDLSAREDFLFYLS
ncbi:alpha/beta fold hydrolase [Candidatus Woesearchaeota archaeon]|nr:alpha/beta fold hydrolase [Candidatus Woesearchaeota archaeon]